MLLKLATNFLRRTGEYGSVLWLFNLDGMEGEFGSAMSRAGEFGSALGINDLENMAGEFGSAMFRAGEFGSALWYCSCTDDALDSLGNLVQQLRGCWYQEATCRGG